MKFFVPGADDSERLYAALAELCGVPVPAADSRIQSLSFVHDGSDWDAAVGERLKRIPYRETQAARSDDRRHHSNL